MCCEYVGHGVISGWSDGIIRFHEAGALLLLMVHGPGKLSMDEQNGPLQIITTKGDA